MHYRSVRQILSTQFERIVCRAGIEPWPKLFQNLRSTRETELMEDYPAHVVCVWIGNSEAVARKHYLQITDDHFAKAVGKPAITAPLCEDAVQNPVQQMSERSRTAPHAEMAEAPQTPLFPVFAELCDLVHKCTVPLRGVQRPEPKRLKVQQNPIKTHF